MQSLKESATRSGLILLWLIMIGGIAPATAVMEKNPVPGIWASEDFPSSLSLRQKEILEKKLRWITGWQSLQWSEKNQLVVKNPEVFRGGSEMARKIFRTILYSGKKFIIESHNQSPLINFGQLDEGLCYVDEGKKIKLEIYRVRLDFEDFNKIEASPEVRESFDPGFTLAHELLHGLGLKDPRQYDEVGDCEKLVNKIRAELNLPLRDQYFGDLLNITYFIKSIRLRFKEPVINQANQTGRWNRRYLFFLLDVGQLETLRLVNTRSDDFAPSSVSFRE